MIQAKLGEIWIDDRADPILVCGSRGWNDGRVIDGVLRQIPRHVTILVGDARGADHLVYRWALNLGFTDVRRFVADWERYGKQAGYIRNSAMLDLKPEMVVAFWDGRSHGTWHVLREAERRGIPYRIYTEAA